MIEDKSILIEQYKLYTEVTDRVSARRAATNRYYISLLSALFAFITFVINKKICSDYSEIVLCCFTLLGVLLCGVWFINIKSYKQLNSGKFKVIHLMEKQLPFRCFDEEWKILGSGKDSKKYRKLTKIELAIPAILAVPYLILFFYYARSHIQIILNFLLLFFNFQ
ncbi:conserved hypothetical protein [Desulforapulum autotrophicum HRM2]|uniref:Uncharacterized protein n=1 Tax=Desulforapulum autotrophicum (strain ATCC 43914 / DSM 3382 / VKM B-1955 / HRM2) TaxID=177437 RepID=C0Q9K5_DESAH|nr:hypothetical protein [Desulforapulum autotrophicum]ACN14569.1 conserved hypothetical protein [Desulforapulum autotrophicum HRM2]